VCTHRQSPPEAQSSDPWRAKVYIKLTSSRCFLLQPPIALLLLVLLPLLLLLLLDCRWLPRC
jgi:hypothetical protein